MSKSNDFIDIVHEAVRAIGNDAIPIIEKHLNIHFENNKCCCPFHNEDTPSFVWNPKTSTAKCFGCNKNYSILNVLTDQKGSYKEALNELFRIAHMDVNTYGYKPFNNTEYTDWFKDYIYPKPELEPTDKVVDYLAKRGISKDTIDYAEIKEDKNGNIAFEYRDLDNELLCVKYRPTHAIKKGEPKMWFQKDVSSVPLLWNVKKLDYIQPLVITEGECFPSDVELLTLHGWVSIKDYIDCNDHRDIATYNKDGRIIFETPLALIKKPYKGDMIEYDSNGYHSLTTFNHNLVYIDKKNKIHKCKASKLLMQENAKVLVNFGYGLETTQIPDSYLIHHNWEGIVYCVTVSSGMLLVRYKDSIHVTGNCDALATIEAGYTNVASIPNGAGSLNWIEFNYDYLQNFERIILYFDNDRAGKEGLEKVIPRLGEYRCKIVKPTSEDEQMVTDYYEQFGVKGICKTDANNILLACGKQRLLELIDRAEEIPTKNLKYLMDCENQNINDIEKTSTGLKAVDDMFFGNLKGCLTIYTGLAGCVDCDTEFFNGYEWKRIADYQNGDKVLQYNTDGTATLVKPELYHKYTSDYLWNFSTKYGIDQCLSDEHEVYYITSKHNINHKQFSKIKEVHENTLHGFSGKFITSFEYGRNGINLTDAEIKLMCAVICDGSFYYDNRTDKDYSHRLSNNTCRFHIKKERKKNKLREIFTECGLKWREIESATIGYTDFYVVPPRHEKKFTSYWYNCTQRQFKIVCDNILFWDGHTDDVRKSFSTNIKENADFVQFAFTSCGYRARISTKDRVGEKYLTNGKWYTRQSIEYTVSITNRTLIGMTRKSGDKTKITKYKTTDGYKYCFTVPSHMWIMRRNGCIAITGNSGKSSLCNLTSVIAPIENGKKVFIFSGELSEGQLLNWVISPLGGVRHTSVWDVNGSERKGFSITAEAEKAIRQYYHDNIILYSDINELETNEKSLLQAMEIAYRKYNCEYFLIDNLMSIEFEDIGNSIYDNQKKFMVQMMNFTNRYQVCCNVVMHPRKMAAGEQELGIYSISGSSNLSNLAHRMVAVKRINEEDNPYSIEIQCIKDRPTQSAGKKCQVFYDYCTRRIYSNNEELFHKYNWEKNFTAHYSDAIKNNLICNRQDILRTIPMQVDYSNECTEM